MSQIRSNVTRILVAAGAALVVAMPSVASAQIVVPPPTTACGPTVKEEVIKLLADVDSLTDDAKAALYDSVYQKYSSCGTSDAALTPPTSTFFVAARECGAAVSQLGSLFYEELPCAGYDPQRRQFAAPIKIKQVF